MKRAEADRCPLCRGVLNVVYRYARPPEGETHFGIPLEEYEREYRSCARCGLFLGVTDLDLEKLYSGAYVDATYSKDGITRTFDRIMSLPPERSDNVQRVARIVERLGPKGRVLDVGSGLGVFPARMKEAGWEVTALDPDPRAVEFTRAFVGTEAVCADFMEQQPIGPFDLITFNKVLEHVPDPVAMLRRAHDFLAADGSVYVELPDTAARRHPDGGGREEFFIEHLWVFSPDSLALLARAAGFKPALIEQLREPSGKYTVYAFLVS